MKHHHFLILSLLSASLHAPSRKMPPSKIPFSFLSMEEPTIADEFIYVYEKNNFNNDRLYYEDDVDEYFGLFVNFKLKG
jgi:hypothetical protein